MVAGSTVPLLAMFSPLVKVELRLGGRWGGLIFRGRGLALDFMLSDLRGCTSCRGHAGVSFPPSPPKVQGR